MANHGYITTKKRLTAKRVRADLEEINQRRFKGLLSIEDSNWGDKGSWFISYPVKKGDYPQGFNIWLTSQRRLEHRHSRNWAYYVELVFAEELGAKYDATMSDDGHSQKWKPKPRKYPTYLAWLDVLYAHTKKKHPDAYQTMVAMEIKYLPKELKDC